MHLDQTLLLFFCCSVAFIAGYGVREVISARRRREERKMREAHERLMRARAAATESPMKERAAQGEGASHMPAEEDEDQRWLDIVIRAFERLGTRPSLSAIYDEVDRLISATKFQSNRAPEATVRRLLQSHCATSPQFGGKESFFLNPSRGKWRLDKDAAERRWQSREDARKFLAELGL
jgi:hypothetical protein